MTTSQPVRWGILSTAGIALRRVIPVLQQNPALMEVRAIASRQQAAAEGAAQAHGIAVAYGSYEALLADPDIDAIYNPLPNHLHVPLTLAALQAGKHVLCEKPFAMNAAELAALRPYATQLHIREAFMVRHHPQWAAVRSELRAGALGTLRFMQVPFGYFNTDAANIRNRPEAGGGALYDIGCYAIAAARWCFEREPLRVACSIDRDADFGTDRLCSALLDFGAEGQMVFSVSTQAHRYQRLHLVGTQGRLEMEMPSAGASAGPLPSGPGTLAEGGATQWRRVLQGMRRRARPAVIGWKTPADCAPSTCHRPTSTGCRWKASHAQCGKKLPPPPAWTKPRPACG